MAAVQRLGRGAGTAAGEVAAPAVDLDVIGASAIAGAGAGTDPRIATAWAALAAVPDPEVPALSVCDLGIVRDVVVLDAADAQLEVVLTPTYSGCPATEVIADHVRAAIVAAGLGPARITLRRAPAWSTDWISEEGRRKLREYGIAPPGHLAPDGAVPIRLFRPSAAPKVACPRCDSPRTEQLSQFGSTACKSLYRCLACREPFEYFKPL